jgi:hypothetical protein
MSVSSYADDLGSAVHYALETTHAIAVCPFHLNLTIRIGDDAAESHAFARARKQERWHDVGGRSSSERVWTPARQSR